MFDNAKLVGKNVIFSLIVVTVFFLLLETACRIKLSHSRNDPLLLFYGRTFFELKIKALSYRIKSVLPMKTDNTDNVEAKSVIWTYGGSITVCNLTPPDESWPIRLGMYLNEQENSKIKVLNKATVGASCGCNSEWFKNHLLFENKCFPDLVIFHMGINDAAIVANYPDTIKKKGKIRHSILTILNCRLMQTSLLYATIKEKFFTLTSKNVNNAWNISNVTSAKRDMDHFKRHLNRVINTCEEFDIRLVVSAIPLDRAYLRQWPKHDKAYESLIEAMRQITSKRNITFINLNEEMFLKYPDFGKHFIDGVHLDVEGDALIARFYADYIIENNMLPSS